MGGNIAGGRTLIGPKQATTTSTQLPAGHYGLLCFLSAADGTPHAAHGMIKVIDVKGPKSSDFPLSNPGHYLSLKITNAGTTARATLVKLERGKTIDDAKAYYAASCSGQPPPGNYGYVSTEGDDPATDDSTRGLKGEFTVK